MKNRLNLWREVFTTREILRIILFCGVYGLSIFALGIFVGRGTVPRIHVLDERKNLIRVEPQKNMEIYFYTRRAGFVPATQILKGNADVGRVLGKPALVLAPLKEDKFDKPSAAGGAFTTLPDSVRLD